MIPSEAILLWSARVGGVSAVVPVDLHIRGCPPSPTALLKGLIALVD